jgi:hypothetical protein
MSKPAPVQPTAHTAGLGGKPFIGWRRRLAVLEADVTATLGRLKSFLYGPRLSRLEAAVAETATLALAFARRRLAGG